MREAEVLSNVARQPDDNMDLNTRAHSAIAVFYGQFKINIDGKSFLGIVTEYFIVSKSSFFSNIYYFFEKKQFYSKNGDLKTYLQTLISRNQLAIEHSLLKNWTYQLLNGLSFIDSQSSTH